MNHIKAMFLFVVASQLASCASLEKQSTCTPFDANDLQRCKIGKSNLIRSKYPVVSAWDDPSPQPSASSVVKGNK